LFVVWLFVIALKAKYLRLTKKRILKHAYEFIFLGFFVLVVFVNYLFVSNSQYALQHLLAFSFYIVVLIIACYYSCKPMDYAFSILVYIILLLGVQAAVSIPYLLTVDSMT